MDYEHILYEPDSDDPRIVRITLNRPEKLNALSPGLLRELFAARDHFDDDPSAVCLIMKGSGRAFSSGYDLGSAQVEPGAVAAAPNIDTIRRTMNWTVEEYIKLWNLRKPTIAQIHGYCLSGGTELSSMCDFIVAAENTQIGHIAGRYQGTLRTNSLWPWTIGMRRSKEILMTGDLIDGRRAAEWGMVNQAVPADELDDAATDLARRIVRIPLPILTLHKHSVNRWFETQGIYAALRSAVDFDAMGTFTGVGEEFRQIVQEKGLKEALRWRDAPWADFQPLRPTEN
ncbi:MAG TPA: enoyl-CoA hydratase-related protein [Dehalococcoidia bacterium]|nr:enoyl-CoA hydratase-related protein [Dehalococcoidia bacterium]